MCNFLLRDLQEYVISFQDILIKCTFPIDFNVKFKGKINQVQIKNAKNSLGG